jgi:predicted nuclease of restriction endonuclease-like (RecB) superfamily
VQRIKLKNQKPSFKLYERIKAILEAARKGISRTVNTTQVMSCWLIGREIVEDEQAGKTRAQYGSRVIEKLSAKLQSEFGGGYSVQNLFYMRQFYREYPSLLPKGSILHAVRGELGALGSLPVKLHAVRGECPGHGGNLALSTNWRPGNLHSGIAWSHYKTLLRVEKSEARAFYEIETTKNNWSGRELERQINSLLYERLSLSKDKKGLLKLATRGQEIQKPLDAIKDPIVMEFVGLPASHKLVETKLEEALINDLQAFLLELGKGFAFVSRQERITLDGDHNYIDLVFYHTILKCYVLIDLKVGKLMHQDLGQLQVYVNYFDEERRTRGDKPTIGLILCTDKNEAVVRYFLGKKKDKRLFASRYKLHLPSEAELKAEVKRELRFIKDNKA